MTLASASNYKFHNLKETSIISAIVLLILTLLALVWPWEQLPRARSFNYIWNMGVSGISAAIVEEIVFRGWLQPILIRRLGNLYGIIAVNLIFAPLHLIAVPNWISLCTFFPGFIMSWLKERHDSLVSPIIFHILGNIWAIWFFPSPVVFK